MKAFAIHRHESATGIRVSLPAWTPLLPPSPPHPSGLSPSASFGCPASCVKLALVIYFTCGDVHASRLLSQIVPPSPSPTESKVCFFHLCLLCCPTCRIIGTVFLNSTYELIHSIRLSLNDLLHSIQYTLGSSTSLELTQRHSFLWMSNIPLCICTTILYPFICWLLPHSIYCK